MMTLMRSIIPILLISILTGCALGPSHKRPEVNTPESFRCSTAPEERASLADLPWWEVFKDENLHQLIQEALRNNYDLRVAVSRVEQARYIAVQARSQLFPQIGYNGGISTGKNASFGNPAPVFSQESSTSREPNDDKLPQQDTSPRVPERIDIASIDLQALWEIDLWGRIRRLNEAALAQLMATEDARRGVMISLISQVAQAYFELLELDLELAIARKNTKSFEETLRIFTQRLQGGVASKLETSTAEASLATVAANIPEIERQIVLKENQINVLLGRNPCPIERKSTFMEQAMPPEIPAGLPSALLERRPDIREAENRLRAANAQVGIAMTNFFPNIRLTALLGQVSPELHWFASGAADMWNIAATFTGPLFQGGSLMAQYRQAQAAWEEARLLYQQTALNAFQEVSNALISRQKYEEARTMQLRAVRAYEEAVQVALKRYVAGKASYYEVLQNQQQLFPAETQLAKTDLNRFLVLVQLYKALGGGWQRSDE